MAERGGPVSAVLVAVLWSLFALVGPAAALTLVSVTPTFPVVVNVGQMNAPALITVTNQSSPPESSGTITLGTVTLVPSCGAVAVECTGFQVDPGVFQATQAVGGAGACAGVPFSMTVIDATQGKLQITPQSPVLLGAPGGSTDSCRIDLQFNVLRRPARDAQPAIAGVQTVQLASATATSDVTGASSTATGVSTVTVNPAVASISTLAGPQPAMVGQSITDTATVTGVPNAPAPTSGVIFTVYFDPPGAAPCSGPSENIGLVGLTPTGGGNPPTSTATSPPVVVAGPGTYRFVAGYIGDANYEGLPTTPCDAPGESVNVIVPGRYVPLTPARIVDTRVGIGGIAGPVGPHSTVSVPITGQGGVPPTGVSAVAMSVTVTSPTGDGFLTFYPSGTVRPLASNLNFSPGKTVPNLVVVKLGSDGRVDMFNLAGSTHVIYDVTGYFSDDPTGNDGRFQPLIPARILDTRTGVGGSSVRLGPNASLDLQVTGAGEVPPAGAEAVVMNVAVTNTDATSFLTVFPTGEARPLASNLNWVAGNTVSSRVIAKLGANGRVTLYNLAGNTDLIVDTNGWFTDANLASVSGLVAPTTPTRILDTRDNTGGFGFNPVPAGATIDVPVTGLAGVPANATAVILNATVVSPAGPGFLTIFPTGIARPNASDLNYAAGEIRPNLVIVKLGTNGRVSLYTPTGTHVIFDVAGYFT